MTGKVLGAIRYYRGHPLEDEKISNSPPEKDKEAANECPEKEPFESEEEPRNCYEWAGWGSCSWHGLSNSAASDKKIERIVWILVFLASTCLCIFFFQLRITDYLAATAIISYKNDRVSELEIPEITICTQHGFDNTELLSLADMIKDEIYNHLAETKMSNPDLLKAGTVSYLWGRALMRKHLESYKIIEISEGYIPFTDKWFFYDKVDNFDKSGSNSVWENPKIINIVDDNDKYKAACQGVDPRLHPEVYVDSRVDENNEGLSEDQIVEIESVLGTMQAALEFIRSGDFCERLKTEISDFDELVKNATESNPSLDLSWLKSWNHEFICKPNFDRVKDSRQFCEAYFMSDIVEETFHSILRDEYLKLWANEIVFDMMNSADVQQVFKNLKN